MIVAPPTTGLIARASSDLAWSFAFVMANASGGTTGLGLLDPVLARRSSEKGGFDDLGLLLLEN